MGSASPDGRHPSCDAASPRRRRRLNAFDLGHPDARVSAHRKFHALARPRANLVGFALGDHVGRIWWQRACRRCGRRRVLRVGRAGRGGCRWARGRRRCARAPRRGLQAVALGGEVLGVGGDAGVADQQAGNGGEGCPVCRAFTGHSIRRVLRDTVLLRWRRQRGGEGCPGRGSACGTAPGGVGRSRLPHRMDRSSARLAVDCGSRRCSLSREAGEATASPPSRTP